MFIVCIVAFVILVLISVPKMPLYFDAGAYEGARTLTIVFPAIGFFYFLRRYRSYRWGIEGEEKVTLLLQRSLGDYYYLVNDVVYTDRSGNKRNIDHIVLGPNAVFAIETKNWTRFYYNPTVQAQQNAQWVQKTIVDSKVLGDRSLWVQALVVFINFHKWQDLSTQNVEVLEISNLADYVQSHGHDRFSLKELEAMARILCKATQ